MFRMLLCQRFLKTSIFNLRLTYFYNINKHFFVTVYFINSLHLWAE